MTVEQIPQELKDRFDAIIVQHPLREDTRDGRLEQIYEIMNGLHDEHANHLIEALIEEAEKRRELQSRLSTVEAERDAAETLRSNAVNELARRDGKPYSEKYLHEDYVFEMQEELKGKLSAAEKQLRDLAEYIQTHNAVCNDIEEEVLIAVHPYLSQQKGESHA